MEMLTSLMQAKNSYMKNNPSRRYGRLEEYAIMEYDN
jgi:hypothetical protein